MHGTFQHVSSERRASERHETTDEPGARRILTCAWSALLLCASLAQAAQPADLSLTKTVSNPTPTIGTQVTFTVTVNNAGPGGVQRATVRDKLPTGYTYVSSTPSRGTYNPSNGQWTNIA